MSPRLPKNLWKREVLTMEKIKFKYIVLSIACLVAAVVCIGLGIVKWLFFIPAAICICMYIVIDRKYLRRPKCSGFTNLDRLLYAKNKEYHCSGCGERLYIE